MGTEEVTLDVGLDNMIVVHFDEKRCESCVKHMKKSGYIPDECDCLVKETTKRIDSLKKILYDYDSEVICKGFIGGSLFTDEFNCDITKYAPVKYKIIGNQKVTNYFKLKNSV